VLRECVPNLKELTDGMSKQRVKQEVIELEDVILIINGSPTPVACKYFIRMVNQMKVSQKKAAIRCK
jgi:hypothetical protein